MSDASSDQHHVERQNVPWGPFAGVSLSFFGFFVVQIVIVLLISLLVRIFLPHTTQEDLSSPIATFGLVVFSDAAILSVLWLFLRRRRGTPAQLGFRRPKQYDLLYAVGGYLVYFGLLVLAFVAVDAFTGIDLNKKQELGFDNVVSTLEKVLAFISLTLLPPIVEETLFRGFLFAGLRNKLRFVYAAICTSVLFAALHLLGTSEGLLWVAAVDTFVLSLVLCYLREKTGALWASILVHMAKNAIAFVVYLSAISGS
jgi:membrane protease YdiL (CAAX protease family)